ncbi:MAG: NADH-quinone oxidoreductase subunit H [Candidatus Margulisiibacteriota bacterium]
MTIYLINIAYLIFMPVIFSGIIGRVKSIWAGRQGPGLFQPLFDLIKLCKKGQVISSTATFIFNIAPAVNLAAVITALLLVPINKQSFIGFPGDLIVFAYLIALGKFFMIIGAMDTGSSFEGMGASREAIFTASLEPALFIIFASLAMISGVYSFFALPSLFGGSAITNLMMVIITAILFLMLIIENCRVPFDDPATHLELTMIHEVMVLDNSGPDLAMINFASSLKMTLFSLLIAMIALPRFLGPVHYFLATLAITVSCAVIVGLIESLMSRMKMSYIPLFVFSLVSLALIVLALAMLIIYGGLQ